MIKGAEEYYEYTKTLSKEEAYALTGGEGSKFREMVGMEIVDKSNIIYHCISEKPYFDTLATSNCLYPLAQGLVDELGVDGVGAMNNENMSVQRRLYTDLLHSGQRKGIHQKREILGFRVGPF